jgi:hypothetical protein
MLQVPPRQPPSPRRPRRPMSAPAAVLGHHLPRDKAARPSVKVTFSSDPARTPLRRVRPPGVNSGHPPEAAPLRHRPPQGHRAAAAGRKAARNTPEEPSHERAPLRARRPAPPTTADREHRACPTAAPSRRPSSDVSALLWAQGQGADQGLPLPPRQPPSPRPPSWLPTRSPALLRRHLPPGNARRASARVTFSLDPSGPPRQRAWTPGGPPDQAPEMVPLSCMPDQGRSTAGASCSAALQTPLGGGPRVRDAARGRCPPRCARRWCAAAKQHSRQLALILRECTAGV